MAREENIVTVILYKDMSANIAMASLDPAQATCEDSMGIDLQVFLLLH